MEVLWRSYGIPMDHHGSNTLATPDQDAGNWLAPGFGPPFCILRSTFASVWPAAGLHKHSQY